MDLRWVTAPVFVLHPIRWLFKIAFGTSSRIPGGGDDGDGDDGDGSDRGGMLVLCPPEITTYPGFITEVSMTVKSKTGDHMGATGAPDTSGSKLSHP